MVPTKKIEYDIITDKFLIVKNRSLILYLLIGRVPEPNGNNNNIGIYKTKIIRIS